MAWPSSVGILCHASSVKLARSKSSKEAALFSEHTETANGGLLEPAIWLQK